MISSNTPTATDYIELKILDSNLLANTSNLAGWKLRVYRNGGGGAVNCLPNSRNCSYNDADLNSVLTGASSAAVNDYCQGTAGKDTYIRVPFASGILQKDSNVVLLDNSGAVVDLLRITDANARTSLPSWWTGESSCASFPSNVTTMATPFDSDIWNIDANKKNLQRLPDGMGPWVQAAGTGANSEDSLCTSNDSILSVVKTPPSPATVGVGSGSTFTWTFLVSNGGTNSALTNVTVSDTLPTTPGNMYLSSCPAGATCAGSAGAYTSFSKNLGTINAGTSITFTATAYVTAAGTYTNAATVTATELAPGYTQTSASVTAVAGTDAANFNCLDSAVGALVNYSGAGARLFTKLTGTAFSLDVVALKSDGSLETGFVGAGGGQKNVTLELVDNTQGTACPVGACAATCGASIAAKTIRFPASDTTGRSATDNATGAAVSFSSATAYRNLVCRITDANQTPELIRCSSDAFAIRPQQLTLSQSGLAASPMAAGNDFTLTGTPGGAGYTTGPQFELTRVGVANAAGVPSASQSAIGAGMLTLNDVSNTAVNAGTVFPDASGSPSTTSLGLRYHDVGYLYFNAGAVFDGSFVAGGIDPAGTDCVTGSGSNTLTGGLYGCQIWGTALNDLGRFRPSHFAVSGSFTPGCSSGLLPFTYMDQPSLGVSMVVAAKSAQSITSTRYGNANCPVAGSCTLNLTARSGANQIDIARLTPLAGFPSSTALVGSGVTSSYAPAAATSWTNGSYTVDGTTFLFAKSTAGTDGPLSLSLQAAIDDPDGVLIAPAAANAIGPTTVRNGRVRLSSAFGNASLPLPLPTEVQYWNGTYWTKNTDDSGCASSALPEPTRPAGVLPVGSAPYASTGGGYSLTFSAATATAGDVSYVGVAGFPAWLRFPWTGGAMVEPTAKIDFGIYKGSNRFIYRREVR